MEEKYTYQTLPADRLEEASRLLADAFIDGACYVDMYRRCGDDVEWRRSELQWLFHANLLLSSNKNPEQCRCCIDKETNELVSVYMFSSNELGELSLWEKISGGLLMIPFRVGWQTLFRLMAVSDFAQLNERSLVPEGSKYYTFERVAVKPGHQGKGLGSWALGKAVAEADRMGVPIILGTQKEVNVTFYSRL